MKLMFNKIFLMLSSLICISMTLSCIIKPLSISALASSFADVPTSHWAYKYITEMSRKGIIDGYDDGTF